jgi:hypothetical protein
MNTVTIVTAWYQLKNKFNKETYKKWTSNLLDNIMNSNIIIYTDQKSKSFLEQYINKPHIHIIIKELHEFKTYHSYLNWIKNQDKNHWLHFISWELVMLWCEKIAFVEDAKSKFYSDWYIWCDIGYFRGRENDIPNETIQTFPNLLKIQTLNTDKIYYGYVGNKHLIEPYILEKNEFDMPKIQPPLHIDVIAGGFFICSNHSLEKHSKLFYTQLHKYFMYDYMIKDDQTILNDIILSHPNDYILVEENQSKYDLWFVFQRYLT